MLNFNHFQQKRKDQLYLVMVVDQVRVSNHHEPSPFVVEATPAVPAQVVAVSPC
uniref:Uncharacterized protein n=1 Tax=Ciona intestinalis TaxID=7719 RepID=H2XUS3_CIOIN